jgi:uncharacterized membrane protein YfcA
MDLTHPALLISAGLAAGAVNAVAGGGSLVSFPALVAAGYPSLTANVTNTAALWPGYIGGVVGFRADLDEQRTRAVSYSLTSVAGAIAGCLLLLATPGRVFDALVPILILLACVLLGAQPWVSRAVRRLTEPGSSRPDSAASRGITAYPDTSRLSTVLLHGGIFVGGAYGAYFGAGLGVLLLGILGAFLPDRLNRVNAVRSVLSLVINTVALLAFTLFGPVQWRLVAMMAPASLLGGFLGARAARRMSAAVLRMLVVAFGVAVASVLALR